ncbi:hypothetical protein MAUB1S_11415 [Mycolicibacterium aubagnense]
MIAAGVAIGFIGWFAALVAGSAINSNDAGVGLFLVAVSFVLFVTSYWMVAP